MKKLIIAAAALLISVSSFAQFGITGGLTSSSSNLKDAWANYKAINQYHIGVTYKLGIGNILAIQPSLIYNMKGQKIELLESGATNIDLQYKTGYIELPVQIQAGFGVGDLARIYAIAEPFVGYAVSNKVEIVGKLGDSWDNVKNKFEYGVGLGAGVELFKHLQVSVRYFWNLGTVYGTEIDYAGVKKAIGESKCNGISASVAFLF